MASWRSWVANRCSIRWLKSGRSPTTQRISGSWSKARARVAAIAGTSAYDARRTLCMVFPAQPAISGLLLLPGENDTNQCGTTTDRILADQRFLGGHVRIQCIQALVDHVAFHVNARLVGNRQVVVHVDHGTVLVVEAGFFQFGGDNGFILAAQRGFGLAAEIIRRRTVAAGDDAQCIG